MGKQNSTSFFKILVLENRTTWHLSSCGWLLAVAGPESGLKQNNDDRCGSWSLGCGRWGEYLRSSLHSPPPSAHPSFGHGPQSLHL